MMELLTLPFFLNALLAGVLVAASASYLGVFVVQRGLSFLGDGLAHSVLGGVSLGLLLGVTPFAISLPFTLLIAVLITWVKERTTLRGDAVIGVFFSLSAALGILFLSLRPEYGAEAMSLLFGSILSVQKSDLIAACILFFLTVCSIPLWGRLAYASFDRELAVSDGVRATRDDFLLSILVALSVAIAVRVVGVLLVSSFLVIPATSARLLGRRIASVTVLSVFFGVLSMVLGLFASGTWDLPPGASVVLTQSALFFLSLVFRAR